MSRFDVGKFSAALNTNQGPMLLNRFFVRFKIPQTVATGNASEMVSFMCESAPLPGVSIGTDDRSQPYGYGIVYKMPWGAIFTDISLTFLSDNKGYIHNIFTSWLNKIVFFNTQSNTKIKNGRVPFFVSYRDEYITEVEIFALDPNEKVIMKYTLHEAFPSLIGDIYGSWASNNQTVRIPIRFNFTHWSVVYEKLSDNDIEAITSKLSDPTQQQSITQQQVDNVSNYIATNLIPTNRPAPTNPVNEYKDIIPLMSNTTYNI